MKHQLNIGQRRKIMTLEELVSTQWANDFKAQDPVSYDRAIELALIPKLPVDIVKTNETGDWVWAIVAKPEPGFWMDAFTSKKKAVELCRKMGWKYTIKDNTTIERHWWGGRK